MMNNEESLKSEISRLLNSKGSIAFRKIPPDGSMRIIYRILLNNDSYIGIYNPSPSQGKGTNENDTFIYIQNLLKKNGLRVPEIICQSQNNEIIICQDLGDQNYKEYYRKNGYDTVLKKILEDIYRIGRIFKINEKKIFNNEYDHEFIYNKECLYFVENYVIKHLKYSKSHKIEIIETALKDFSKMYNKLTLKGFMHRDMQSSNIIVKDNEPYYIDFQGGRKGHRCYDFASFICDAYTDILESHNKKVYNIICEILSKNNEDSGKFFEELRVISIYRLLQMLGAFCNLYYNRKKAAFHKYIHSAEKKFLYILNNTHMPQICKLKSVLQHIFGDRIDSFAKRQNIGTAQQKGPEARRANTHE